MNEWLKKLGASVKDSWAKWTITQKGIVIGIVVVIIAAFILTFSFSSKPTTVQLFNAPVTDETARDKILYRLDQENVKAYVDSSGIISVDNENTARRMRDLLITEDLVPSNINPYAFFDQTNWSTTDFERKVNWQRAITELVKQHLEALDDVASADVNIVMPEETLFSEEQNPVTASVILKVMPGSDMLTNRKKILGVRHTKI